MITIKIDTTDVKSLFNELGNKLPKVMSSTVNVLADMIKESTVNEMKSKFKGGTSNWVLNSFGIKKASQSNLTAEVFYNRTRHFMEVQVDGGDRTNKASESMLQSKGVMQPGTDYLPEADRDQYGNISPATLRQVLSYFQTYSGTKNTKNRSGTTLNNGLSFFALKQQVGQLHAGVFMRVGNSQTNAMRAQRAMIAKRIIQTQYKGKAGKEQRQALMKQLKATNKALLPRGISMVMAFDKIKAYTPLIKFYEVSNQIVADNTDSVFRKVAAIEMGGRVQW